MLNTEKVGKILQRFRKDKGLTQEELSGFADLDRIHYSKIERGLRLPTLETLFKISYALEIQPHRLVVYIENEAVEQD